MRILLDYRPALRERTGVGEYVHELTRALADSAADDHIKVLTTSWKDRPSPTLRSELSGVEIVDRRIPVRGLIWAWHRLEWPPVEWLAGDADVVHGQTPLLIPASRAAQVITIHDLDFLRHPERAQREMRTDFPRLVREHAHRADHIIVSSRYAAQEVVKELGVPANVVSVCSPGAPAWTRDVARERTGRSPELILFVGTVEPRKNVRGLLDAYATLRRRVVDAPPLVIAGRAREPLEGDLDHVSVLGYVSEDRRRELYRDARMLVMPSLEEGFGLPVLEAMACGVPVVISNRGALPEVAGDAAHPIDPADRQALADEMQRLLDPDAAREASRRGVVQAGRYSWAACAAAARHAYAAAIASRARRGR